MTPENIGKGLAYVGYNMGGSMLVGAWRISNAVHHIHHLEAHKSDYEKAKESTDPSVKEWTGFRYVETVKKQWEKQVTRGLTEMIPFASFFWTAHDYFSKDKLIACGETKPDGALATANPLYDELKGKINFLGTVDIRLLTEWEEKVDAGMNIPPSQASALRVGLYALYIFGGSLITGICRIAMAIAFLARHYLWSTIIKKGHDAFKQEASQAPDNVLKHYQNLAEVRKKENQKVETERENASLHKLPKALVSEGLTKLKNAFDEKIDQFAKQQDLQDVQAKSAQAAVLIDAEANMLLQANEDLSGFWKDQLYRGIHEVCLPVIGAAYHTYKDCSDKDSGLFGIHQVTKILTQESELSGTIKNKARGYDNQFSKLESFALGT